MENPFPGMDPWMEGDWCNARFSLLQYIADDIRASLPAGLLARVEEREFRKRGLYVMYRNIEVRERRPSRRTVTIVEVLDPLHKCDGRKGCGGCNHVGLALAVSLRTCPAAGS